METRQSYDAIIIGTGQSGIPLAKTLAAEGWKAAIIEKHLVGGSCINYGCTPSKTMAASSDIIYRSKRASIFGIHNLKTDINFKEIIERKTAVVKSFREGLEKGLEATNNLTLLRGEAEFYGKKMIRVNLNDGKTITITPFWRWMTTLTR